MKKQIFIVLVLLVLNLFGLEAQTPDVVFQAKFPALFGALKIDENTTYNVALKGQYRDEYARLQLALAEIEKFKLGGADNEILQVFEVKDLKTLQKDNQVDVLMQLIRTEIGKIHKLMYGVEKYGADSIRCVRQLSLYTEFVKQNNLTDAYKPWSVLFIEFPIATKNIYVGGPSVIKNKLKDAANREIQEHYLDTLFMMYDQRIKFFGNDKKTGKGYVLGLKGIDLLKFRKEQVEDAYKILMESIQLEGSQSQSVVVLTAMQATMGVFEKKVIEASVVIDNYIRFGDLLTQILTGENAVLAKMTEGGDEKKIKAAQKDVETTNTAIQGVDALFMNSTVAKCDVLIATFEPKYKANPTDVDLLRKIVKVLDKKSCTDSKLYEDAAVSLYALEPSELAAFSLARLFLKKEKYNDAVTYYDKSIEFSTIDTIKAQYYYEAANALSKLGQLSKSRSYAYKATELKPNFGLPYVLVAGLYAQSVGNCGENSFQKSCVYWLIVDKLIKAKSVDKSIESEVNGLINKYSGSYPNKEEAFMYTVTAGSSITIGCWINETTTARF